VGEIVLLRHGQTEWSAAGRHTSYTNLPLIKEGERQAAALGAAFAGRSFAAVLCSPRRRARDTAELAGLAITQIDDDLAEWDYGEYEGLTTREIQRERPGWDQWRDGCPGGESADQVGARLDRVLERVSGVLDAGDVALIAHGHSLRVAAARWVGLPATMGGVLVLQTGTLSLLGHEHHRRAIRRWNAPAG
jgi:broad specificity phosphatase PhoE